MTACKESGVRKRNRLSFVCLQCRKAKTKCDKVQPQCTRCVKASMACIYDVELQQKPKCASKNATIKRLQVELETYKTKYYELLEAAAAAASPPPPPPPPLGPLQLGPSQLGSNEPPVTPPDDIRYIDLYGRYPSLIINGIMKREVKPLAENYIVVQDKFLSYLVSSAFLDPTKDSMVTSLIENMSSRSIQTSVTSNMLKLKDMLLKQCRTEQQKTRISEFVARILQKYEKKNTSTTANAKDSMETQSTDNQTNKSETANDNPPFTLFNGNISISQIMTSMYSNLQHQYLEDRCPINANGTFEYSDLMRYYIDCFEKILPPYDIIVSYKAHFYECIFPNLPFLDKQSFEEVLASIMFPLTAATDLQPVDSQSKKIIINMGKTRLRNKLENLCLLLIILKLSYISLRFNDEGAADSSSSYISKEMLDKYPINNDCIILVEKCLVAENFCACVNENIVTCLLYMWSFFVFSPEEGDFFLEHPTDLLAGLIAMLATSIGLQRDPSDFPQLRNPIFGESIMNHRRILWLATITTTCFESSLKGRYPMVATVHDDLLNNVREPQALETYLEKIKKSMGENFNERLYQAHKISFKRMKLSVLVSDMDKITLRFKKKFSLDEIQDLRQQITELMDATFPILDFKGSKNTNGWITQLTKTLTTEYSITLHSRMMATLVFLRTSTAIFLHYEAISTTVPIRKVLPHYQEYFFKTSTDCLTLVTHFKKFFTGGYGTKYSSLTSYNVTKTAQLILPSVLFGLLAIIIRLELAGVTLLTQYKELSQTKSTDEIKENDPIFVNKANELIGKITSINSMKHEFEHALEETHRLASDNLRFTYFSVFKMLAICDALVYKMKKGELLTGILKLVQSESIHPKLVQAFSMSLNIDLNKRATGIEFLKERNQLVNISLQDLNVMCQKIHESQRDDVDKTVPLQFTTDYTFEDQNFPPQASNPTMPDMNMNINNNVPPAEPVKMFMDGTPTNPAATQNINVSDTLLNDNNTFLKQMANQNNYMQNISQFNNLTPSATANNNEMNIPFNADEEIDSKLDLRGVFGGLDLFDYDFLFGAD